MLTNGREIQRRVNSTRDLAFMLKEISISSQDWEDRDTSMLSTETSSLRPEMEERLKFGGSINNP
jgi:hypothetical protein